ncbi:MAG: hypothetical protein WAM73_13815 [Desulfobacterales bacterium]
MKEIFTKFGGYILVTAAAFIAGIFFGINNAANQDAFFDLRAGNIQLTLGKNKITKYDLTKISKEEASGFVSKIEDLPFENYLSAELRDLRDSFKGPFQLKDIDLVVNVTDDDMIKEEWAQACRGKILYRKISVFKIVEPVNLSQEIKEMIEFMVLDEKQRAVCDNTAIDGNSIIWISSQKASKWLKKDKEELPKTLKVKANILCKITN